MITYESNCPAPMRTILNDFDRLLESFVTKGYFEDHGWHDPAEEYECNQVPDVTRRHIMKIVARSMKRPFIRAHYGYAMDHVRDKEGQIVRKDGIWCRTRTGLSTVCFVIPKRKYLSPIINPLLLVAHPQEHRWHRPDTVVTTWANTADRYFWFRQAEGIEIWNEMSKQFATRDEMRAALKLNP